MYHVPPECDLKREGQHQPHDPDTHRFHDVGRAKPPRAIGEAGNCGWSASPAAGPTGATPNEISSPAPTTSPSAPRRHSSTPPMSVAGAPRVRSATHTRSATGSIGGTSASALTM